MIDNNSFQKILCNALFFFEFGLKIFYKNQWNLDFLFEEKKNYLQDLSLNFFVLLKKNINFSRYLLFTCFGPQEKFQNLLQNLEKTHKPSFLQKL